MSLSYDALEPDWIPDELSDIPVVFRSIASRARQGQVGYAIGSASAASHDMIDLQRNVFGIWRTELGTTLQNGFNSTTALSSYFRCLRSPSLQRAAD